ncbi:YhdP family protein [Pontibacter sp. JAM-7]|uniref:YhdP family protein n=1 Tax=Pontibacter sp. JAM-7 TaxID=3366581 RepID=UPI003AF6D265
MRSVLWAAYWLLVTLMALAAMLVLLLRLCWPQLSNHQEELLSWLGARLQAQVLVENLQADWQQGFPVLHLQGLSLQDIAGSPGVQLSLDQAYLALDLGASVRQLRPVFNRLELDGLHLSLTQAASTGRDKIVSPDHVSDSELPARLLSLVLSQQAISLHNTRLQYITHAGEMLELSPLQLSLRHDGRLHQLQLQARLTSKEEPTNLNFFAEVLGNPKKAPIRLYLELDHLNQAILNPWLSLAGVQVTSLQASQKLWGQVSDGQLEYFIGSTSLNQLQFAQYQLNQLQLKTALVKQGSGYQFQVTEASVGGEQTLELPLIGLNLVRQSGQILPTQLLLDAMPLAELQTWLSSHQLLPQQIEEIFATMAPRGDIRNLVVQWHNPAVWQEFQLEADLDQVSIDAWHDVPALGGVSGLIRLSPTGGAIHLNSQDFSLYFPHLYRAPWHYQQANGVINWHFRDQDVIVGSQLLHLSDSQVTAAGRFSISLPYSKDQQTSLTLMIGMENSQGTQAQHYIPPDVVGDNLYSWLVKALQGGQVKRAGLVLNGDTRRRLDDFQSPSVQMFFDTQAVDFAYQEGWPPVQNTNAFVYYREGNLQIEAEGGQIYDTQLEYVNAYLRNSHPELLLTGALSGSLKDLERLLAETPLRQTVGEGLAGWQMDGDSQTLLQLAIPVTQSGKLAVQVNSDVVKGRFNSPALGLNLSNLAGRINFDSRSGLNSPSITGQLFGQSVKGDIKTARGGSTRINLDGSAPVAQVRKWLDLDLLKIADGSLNYQAQLELCPDQTCRQFSLRSDLKGVSIQAPDGLGKAASTVVPFDLLADVGGDSDVPRMLRFNLGDSLSGVAQTQFGTIRKARFTLGDASPKLPDFDGIWVDGHLPSVDFSQLKQFLQSSGLLAASGEQPKGAVLQEVNVSTGLFTLGGLELQDLTATVVPDNQGWLIQGESVRLKGQLLLPTETDQPMTLKLAHLYLQTSKPSAEQSPSAPEAGPKPEDIPQMNVEIADLRVNQKSLGSWSMLLRPEQNQLNVEQIRADMHGTKIQGELDWQDNGRALTELSLNIKTDNFGQALATWGYAKAVETEKLNGFAQLSWPGAPWDFELAGLAGQVDFKARNGRLLDVGNSGNLLRVFGILNLQSLSRRLRLDFTDLFKSGVAFDLMDASYEIHQGVAKTRSPFLLTGPSANMALTGSLDLVNETVDKDIEVALPVTGNIPLVSVLLGAPQVAGAVFLLDKLLGDPLEKFTTVKYHIAGSWSNPEAQFGPLPDNSKSQSTPGIVLPESGE